LVSSWEQPLSRNRRAVRQVRRPLPRPRRTLRPTLPMPRQPNAHRRLTLPRGASRQIPRRTNPARLHLVARRRRKLLLPPGPSQAQTTPSAQSATPSHVQTNKPPPANSQAEQAPSSGTGNTNSTAQQPNQPNQQSTAKSSSTNVNASVHINDQQRTRVTQSIDHLNVQPLTNVNFSLSVGTAVPRDVRLQTLPADVVEVVPQYRGYSFFVVRDEIVIVEPSTYKIVTVLPRSGGTTAAAPASSSRKVTFTDRDRDVVRKHTQVST